jgi:hypothetical protein
MGLMSAAWHPTLISPSNSRREHVEGVTVGQDQAADAAVVGVDGVLAQRAAGVVADQRDVAQVQGAQEPVDDRRDAPRAEVRLGVHRDGV